MTKILMKTLLVFIGILFLSSCTKNIKDAESNPAKTSFDDIASYIETEAKKYSATSEIVNKLKTELDKNSIREYSFNNTTIISIDFLVRSESNFNVLENSINYTQASRGTLENSILYKGKKFSTVYKKLVIEKHDNKLRGGKIFEIESDVSEFIINKDLGNIINFSNKNFEGGITTRALNKRYLNTFILDKGKLKGYSRVKTNNKTNNFDITINSCIQWYLEVTLYYTDGSIEVQTYELGPPQCSNPCQPDPTRQTEVPDCSPQEGGGSGIQESVYIEADESGNKDSIDIEKFIDCFGQIPDAGAGFEVKLMVDIPVNGSSWAPVGAGFSPGHVFLRLTKTGANGNQISQTIGFYPKSTSVSGLAVIAGTLAPGTPDDVEGIIVNDSDDDLQHEFNASFSVQTTAWKFNSVLNTILLLKNRQYSLSNFNCAHFALSAFNVVAPLNLTSNAYMGFSQSPQGLYNRLTELTNFNFPNSVETNVKKLAVKSKGPC